MPLMKKYMAFYMLGMFCIQKSIVKCTLDRMHDRMRENESLEFYSRYRTLPPLSSHAQPPLIPQFETCSPQFLVHSSGAGSAHLTGECLICRHGPGDWGEASQYPDVHPNPSDRCDQWWQSRFLRQRSDRSDQNRLDISTCGTPILCIHFLCDRSRWTVWRI